MAESPFLLVALRTDYLFLAHVMESIKEYLESWNIKELQSSHRHSRTYFKERASDVAENMQKSI